MNKSSLQNVMNENSTPAEIMEEILRVSAVHKLSAQDLHNTAVLIPGIEAAFRETFLQGKVVDNEKIKLKAGFTDENTVLLPEILKYFLIIYGLKGDPKDPRLTPFFRIWAFNFRAYLRDMGHWSTHEIKTNLNMLLTIFPVSQFLLESDAEIYTQLLSRALPAFSSDQSLLTDGLTDVIEQLLTMILSAEKSQHVTNPPSLAGISPVKYHSKVKELLDLIIQLKLYVADWYFVESTKIGAGRREYINLAKSPLYKVIDLYHKHLDRELNDQGLTHLVAKLRLIDTTVDYKDFYGNLYRIVDEIQKILIDEYQQSNPVGNSSGLVHKATRVL